MRAFGISLFIVLLGSAPASAVEPPDARNMGQLRLFTSIAEREQLDQARRDLDREPVVPKQQSRKVVKVQRKLPKVTVQGIVKRSSGEDTVWVNGAGIESGKQRGDIAISQVRGSGQARVVVSGERTVNLKPGQTFDPNSDRVRDRVTVRRGQ